MKLVRFKKEYSDSEPRLSYELVSDEPEIFYLDHPFKEREYQEFYNVKLLGYIPTYKMEEADENDKPAIDAFVKLSNIK